MKGIDCWVQIACPRLSIDWGSGYSRPLLTCYEAFVALGEAEWTEQYPMDWYSAEGGPWSNCQNFFVCHKHNQLLYQRKKADPQSGHNGDIWRFIWNCSQRTGLAYYLPQR